MYCIKCGAEVGPLDQFCWKCGEKRGDVATASSSQSSADTSGTLADVTPSLTQPSYSPSRTPLLVGGSLLVIAIVAWLIASPFVALWRLRNAVTQGDAPALASFVDWNAVRADIKSDVAVLIGVAVKADSGAGQDAAGAAFLAGAVGGAVVGPAVDALVTPENVAALGTGHVPDLSSLGVLGTALASGVVSASATSAADVQARLASMVDYSTSYTSPMTFEVRVRMKRQTDNAPMPVGRIELSRSGLGWVVSGIHFASEVEALMNAAKAAPVAASSPKSSQALASESASSRPEIAVPPSQVDSQPPSASAVGAAEALAAPTQSQPTDAASPIPTSTSTPNTAPTENAPTPPPAPVRVGGAIKPPAKTKDVRPQYPPDAVSARVQGVVIIEATIGPDGKVQDARVLRSIPMLDGAALDAVRQWEFTPTLLNGVPVPVIMTVTVQFTFS